MLGTPVCNGPYGMLTDDSGVVAGSSGLVPHCHPFGKEVTPLVTSADTSECSSVGGTVWIEILNDLGIMSEVSAEPYAEPVSDEFDSTVA